MVAIIFSVGEATSTQARSFLSGSECGYDGTFNSSFPGDYLDALVVPPGVVVDNSDVAAAADSVGRFVNALTRANEDVMNDRLLTITRDEIWQAGFDRKDFDQKMKNLTHALAWCIAEYANLDANDSRRLPWPVKTDLNGADFRDKNRSA